MACTLICTDVRRFEEHISQESMLTPSPTLEQLGFHPTAVSDNREIKDLTMKSRDVTSVITRAAHLTCVRHPDGENPPTCKDVEEAWEQRTH